MEQLITHIRRTRIDPISGNPIDLWKEVGWEPEVPKTPEEEEAKLHAHYDKFIAPWFKITWEEYRDNPDRDIGDPDPDLQIVEEEMRELRRRGLI